MKKKLLILSYSQFGYLTDTLKYCEYLRGDYDITYIGWDYGYNRIELGGVNVAYVPRTGNILARNLRLLRAFHRAMRVRYHLVFANYFRGASILRLLHPRANMILDIRTLAVSRSAAKRFLFNSSIKIESLFYRKLSVISDGVARQMGRKKYTLLPLGSDKIGQAVESGELRLLYVGTLQNRDIIKCVRGFHAYVKAAEDRSATFTIIGDSPFGELEEIRQYIDVNRLGDCIHCTGRIAHNELPTWFSAANVGISFIPMTVYFDDQPPTKTFEYLLSGMAVVGTMTRENVKILQRNNAALLIRDNAEDFAAALVALKQKLPTLNSSVIAASATQYSWKSIVENNFLPLLSK